MKNTSFKKKSLGSLLLVLLLTSVFSINCFAYVNSPSWGVNTPFPASKVFYNSDGSIKTVYTTCEYFDFSTINNGLSNVYPHLTQVYLNKETKIGSGKYGGWLNANATSWCPVSGGHGGTFFGGIYNRVNLPGEGRYKVQVHTFDQNGTYLNVQEFTVLYSYSFVAENQRKIVSDATVDTAAFTNTNGYWSRVNFTVHDLSYNGLTADDIMLKLCNLKWMSASRGNASTYWPTDITITNSTVNPDEYFVSATINATLFDNVSGEYYIECYLLDNINNAYIKYSGMFPHLFIN